MIEKGEKAFLEKEKKSIQKRKFKNKCLIYHENRYFWPKIAIFMIYGQNRAPVGKSQNLGI